MTEPLRRKGPGSRPCSWAVLQRCRRLSRFPRSCEAPEKTGHPMAMSGRDEQKTEARRKWRCQSACLQNRCRANVFLLQQLRNERNQSLYFFYLMAMGDKNCIPCPDNNDIIDSKQSDVRFGIGKNDIVGRLLDSHSTIGRVVSGQLLEVLCDSCPASHVIPIELRRFNQYTAGLFHNCVIDRNFTESRESLF